jgi:hypothetical protein
MMGYYFYSDKKAERITATMGEGRFTETKDGRQHVYTSALNDVLVPAAVAAQLKPGEKIPASTIKALREYDADIDADTIFVVAHDRLLLNPKTGKTSTAWGVFITNEEVSKRDQRFMAYGEEIKRGPLNRRIAFARADAA